MENSLTTVCLVGRMRPAISIMVLSHHGELVLRLCLARDSCSEKDLIWVQLYFCG